MKKYSNILSIILLFTFVSFTTGCGNNSNKEKESQEKTQQVDEFDQLLSYIEQTGDFINSKRVPTMIEPGEVHSNLNENIHVIDIRNAKDFSNGHIPGAQNVKMSDLLDYFENTITPTTYSHIVMVCYTGQSAAYAASILQLLGYNNVYDMKWGMSSWDRNTAEAKWLKNATNKYADHLETAANEKNKPSAYPTLSTGKTTGVEIMHDRAEALLKQGFKPVRVKADELFNNGEDYYIVNYWPQEKYDKGHIPGAIQYDPKKSLGRKSYLNTLPTDKTVVTYCYTGQHSAFVTAYLNMIGYDAKSLLYGANGFMNDLMKERGAKKWHAFSEKKIKNYEMTTSGNNSAADADKQGSGKEKVEVSGGC